MSRPCQRIPPEFLAAGIGAESLPRSELEGLAERARAAEPRARWEWRPGASWRDVLPSRDGQWPDGTTVAGTREKGAV